MIKSKQRARKHHRVSRFFALFVFKLPPLLENNIRIGIRSFVFIITFFLRLSAPCIRLPQARPAINNFWLGEKSVSANRAESTAAAYEPSSLLLSHELKLIKRLGRTAVEGMVPRFWGSKSNV